MNMIKAPIDFLPDTVPISPIDIGDRMKSVTLKLNPEELRLLANLAADQMFRKQFIDPKMPGYRPNTEEMSLGKALVARLRLMLDENLDRKHLA
jgi:hypothetical protein